MFIKENHIIRRDQIIAMIKGVNLPSPYSGKIKTIQCHQGQYVKMGDIIATIEVTD